MLTASEALQVDGSYAHHLLLQLQVTPIAVVRCLTELYGQPLARGEAQGGIDSYRHVCAYYVSLVSHYLLAIGGEL